jgi:hypothetical protein
MGVCLLFSQSISVTNSTYATCILPEGTGTLNAVVATDNFL